MGGMRRIKNEGIRRFRDCGDGLEEEEEEGDRGGMGLGGGRREGVMKRGGREE